uniref:Integrase core domain containing protein n=1 Tax=Solanum tuberosum TaxID=4113 RepID=M1DY58_SOLTU
MRQMWQHLAESPRSRGTDGHTAASHPAVDEYARRASIVDEKLRQQKVRESIADASSFVPILEAVATVRYDVSTNDGTVRVIDITTEGAVIDDVGTTEGDPTIVPAGSGKPDPPDC